MFQGGMPQADAEGVGITSGLGEVAGQMDAVNKGIDSAESPEGIMNVLRGDNQSVEERRSELAGYVGNPDAKQTPESVLTLLQPTFAILDMAETTQAPRTEEATMRIAMGETPVKRSLGSNMFGEYGRPNPFDNQIPTTNTTNQSTGIASTDPVTDRYNKKLDLVKKVMSEFDIGGAPGYDTLLQRYTSAQQPMVDAYREYAQSAQKGFKYNPLIAALNLAGSVASAPKGQLISRVLAPESIKGITDPLLQMAQGTAQAEAQAKLKAAEAESAARLGAAQASAKGDTTKASILASVLDDIIKDPTSTTSKGFEFKTEEVMVDGVPVKKVMVFSKDTGDKVNEYDYTPTANYETIDVGDRAVFVDKSRLADPNYKIEDAPGVDKETKYEYVNLGNGQHAVYDPKTQTVVKTIGSPTFESKFKIMQTPNGDIFKIDYEKIDKKLPDAISLERVGQDDTKLYNFDGAIIRYSNRTGKGEIINQDLGLAVPEAIGLSDFEKEINAYERAKRELALLDPGTAEYKNRLQTINMFGRKLSGYTEFESLMNEQADRVFDTINAISGPEIAEIEKQKYLAKTTQDYLTAKSTKSSTYDSMGAAKKQAAESLYKITDELREKTNSLFAVATDSARAQLLSEQFRTGKFGEFRANVARFAREFGLDNAIKGRLANLGINFEGSLENFLGGSAVSAEVLDSVGKSIAISLAENFPGNLNREEIQIITTVGPSLLKSPEAIKLINQIYAGAAKRNQTILKEVSNKVQGMYKENKSVVDIREEIVRFMDQRKTELETENLEELQRMSEEIAGNVVDTGNQTPLVEGTLRIQTGENAPIALSLSQSKIFPNVQNYDTAQEFINAFSAGEFTNIDIARYTPVDRGSPQYSEQIDTMRRIYNALKDANVVERFGQSE
tara:strand:- start:670 stop:3372 length:2703 start_codon:yes stop_codon:yes gene_type:complete